MSESSASDLRFVGKPLESVSGWRGTKPAGPLKTQRRCQVQTVLRASPSRWAGAFEAVLVAIEQHHQPTVDQVMMPSTRYCRGSWQLAGSP